MEKIYSVKGNEKGKKIALVGLVHGDERYVLKIFKKLKSLFILRGEIDFFIANPKSFKLNKRFIDEDLNRSFNKNSNINSYEANLSKKILTTLKDYDYIIDIHSTTAKTNPFLIFTNSNDIDFVNKFKIKRKVLIEDLNKTSLIANFKCAVSIEISSFKLKYAIKKGYKYILNFLKDENFILNNMGNNFENDIEKNKYKNFNCIYYKVIDRYHNNYDKNFKKIKKNGIIFYPILNGEKSYENKCGFRAIRVYI